MSTQPGVPVLRCSVCHAPITNLAEGIACLIGRHAEGPRELNP